MNIKKGAWFAGLMIICEILLMILGELEMRNSIWYLIPKVFSFVAAFGVYYFILAYLVKVLGLTQFRFLLKFLLFLTVVLGVSGMLDSEYLNLVEPYLADLENPFILATLMVLLYVIFGVLHVIFLVKLFKQKNQGLIYIKLFQFFQVLPLVLSIGRTFVLPEAEWFVYITASMLLLAHVILLRFFWRLSIENAQY